MAAKRKVQGDTPKKVLPNDALVTVSVQTSEGTVVRSYRAPGFLGGTLPWQRTGKGLDDLLIPAMTRVFGGQVIAE